jgi:hypothetical protein
VIVDTFTADVIIKYAVKLFLLDMLSATIALGTLRKLTLLLVLIIVVKVVVVFDVFGHYSSSPSS